MGPASIPSILPVTIAAARLGAGETRRPIHARVLAFGRESGGGALVRGRRVRQRPSMLSRLRRDRTIRFWMP